MKKPRKIDADAPSGTTARSTQKKTSALTERSHRKNNRWPQHVATDSETASQSDPNSKFSTTSGKIPAKRLRWPEIYCIDVRSVVTSRRPPPVKRRDSGRSARQQESLSRSTMEMMIGVVVVLGVVIATGVVQLRAGLRRSVRSANDPQ